MARRKIKVYGHEITLQSEPAYVLVSSAHLDRLVCPPTPIERLFGLTWEKKIAQIVEELARFEVELARKKERATSAMEAALAGMGEGSSN